jgi:hypothetical protein
LVPDDYAAAQAATVSGRQAFGKGYNAARKISDSGRDLVDIAPVLRDLDLDIAESKDTIKAGLKRVKSVMMDDKGRPEITIGALHQAKIAIDDFMDSFDAKSSMGRTARGKIRDYQDRLIDAIESAGESGKLYKESRIGTAGQWRISEALEAGTEFMQKGVKPDLSKMRPEELHAFRTGAAQAIRDRVGDVTVRQDVTKKLFEIKNLEEKTRQAFGDADIFKKYIDGLQNERAMFDTFAEVKTGSQTAARTEAGEALKQDAGGLGQAVGELASGGIANPSAYLRAGAGLVRRMSGPQVPIPVQNQIADILLGRAPEQLSQQYQTTMGNAATRQKIARMLATGLTSQVGGSQ